MFQKTIKNLWKVYPHKVYFSQKMFRSKNQEKIKSHMPEKLKIDLMVNVSIWRHC